MWGNCSPGATVTRQFPVCQPVCQFDRDGLMGGWLAGQDKAAAGLAYGLDNRLAGEQIVAEIDRTQVRQPGPVFGQPSLGGIAFAILVLRPVLGGDSGGSGMTWACPGAICVTPRNL